EFEALASGLGLDPALAFALMHLSILSGRFETDGCTAWARPLPGGGAILAKNRDLSGAHRNFQRVFLHRDPRAPGGAMLAVGTFGAPGVYSSGINAAGLALADTAIEAPVHQIGWLRYFLMTRIALTCTTVEEACSLVASLRHAGGGSLLLADASGAVATVELRAEGPIIDRTAPAARTNHFLSEPLADTAARQSVAAFRSTTGRLEALTQALAGGLGLKAEPTVRAAMATHSDEKIEGLCRHGHDDRSHTVSAAIYDTQGVTLEFADGYPCCAEWRRYVLGGEP
ncbi:MAG: C45 family peptidase, partial [Proteobacteria bacterium]|nr:C45 family peptidase [Pseudomonadota bacterium]